MVDHHRGEESVPGLPVLLVLPVGEVKADLALKLVATWTTEAVLGTLAVAVAVLGRVESATPLRPTAQCWRCGGLPVVRQFPTGTYQST